MPIVKAIRFYIVILISAFCIFNLSILAFAENYKKEIRHCLIQARIEYDNSEYEKALEWWNKALALDPQNKEALRYVKKVEGKLAKGKVISKGKRTADGYILQGKKYYCQHRYSWAISEWEKALKVDPGNKEVLPYIEKAQTRLKQKKSERKPIEFNMLVKAPAPERPLAVFEKPKKEELSLDDAVALGIKNHLPVQIALEQVKLAQFKEREAFRELFPQATVRWDESSGIVSSKDYTGRKYQLKLQHPLYHGGELRYTWEQAKVNLNIAKENYDKAKEEYSLELTKAYYDYVKAIRNFNVQEELLKGLEQDLSIAKKEYDAGISTLIDFLNVQSQYNQVYYSYLSSSNTLSLAKSNLYQFLNLDQDPAVNIKIETEVVFEEHKVDLEECIKLAYENRTDLKMNELTLKSAELGDRVAKSQQLPRVDLTGTIGKAGEVFTPGNLQMSNDWFLGAKVSVPWGPNTMNYSYTNEHIAPSLTVFSPTQNAIHSVRFNILDNLASYTEGKRGEITKQQAYADLIKGKQEAATQVREAYFNYQESTIKVKNSLANKELYQKELAVIRERRLMNEAQTQDIVSAKIKLAGEEVNYNSALVENILSLAKLNKAMGIKNYFK